MENKYKFTNKIIKYGDDKTSALILDTNDTYHKGGFIKKEDGYRVLLQAVYEQNIYHYQTIQNTAKI